MPNATKLAQEFDSAVGNLLEETMVERALLDAIRENGGHVERLEAGAWAGVRLLKAVETFRQRADAIVAGGLTRTEGAAGTT